jgi:hypothetical protein
MTPVAGAAGATVVVVVGGTVVVVVGLVTVGFVQTVTPGMLGPPQVGVGASERPTVPVGRLKARPVELSIKVKLLMIVVDCWTTMVVVAEKLDHCGPT